MENASASALVLICRVISGVTRVDDTRGGNWGCHPGRSAPCPPSDATACDVGDTDLSKDITRWSNEMIVQEYVDSPLLIDGRYR